MHGNPAALPLRETYRRIVAGEWRSAWPVDRAQDSLSIRSWWACRTSPERSRRHERKVFPWPS